MKTFALILLSCLLSACQLKQSTNGDKEALERAYQTMEDAAGDYHRAMEQGDPATAHGSLIRLMESGKACSTTPGCESQRFLYLYTEILEQQASLLNQQIGSLGETKPYLNPPNEYEEPETLQLGDIPAVSGSVNLLNGQDLRKIITVNGPVKAALNEWLTWMRPALMDSYENYQYLRSQMWPEYEQAGLPEALLFGILAKESGGKVHAASPAGAVGLLQFMPATGRRFGLGVDASGFDSRFDPQLATRANVLYLKERFRRLNQDLPLALAAYNGGETRIERLTRNTRQKSFWNPALYSQLPAETRDYVPMVLAAAWLFLHPEEYGIDFPTIDAGLTTLTLQQEASINQLSICIGTYNNRNGWFRALRNLNPRYTAHANISAGTQLRVPSILVERYQHKCISGEQAQQARQLARAAKHKFASPNAGISHYVVRSGDTLDAISRRFSCPGSKLLAKTNSIAPPRYAIKPGQTLLLSGCGKKG
jgi:membrane-bound lytic murein transglycosylase D